MKHLIKLLDCTLRDGAYINDSHFGDAAIGGIIKKMQDACIDIIECGWLKDNDYIRGTTYFHVPDDVRQYIKNKSANALYSVMIDWDRYNVDCLPQCDGKTIDAIRVVFPNGRYREGIEVGKRIRDKGYQVMLQAANTLAYSDDELIDLAECVNIFHPVSLSIVDTFGAMFFDDIERIAHILDDRLHNDIELGFHAHNNQQLAFALCIRFVEIMEKSDRNIILDATLSGMGRGAGNATTELVAGYLDRKLHGNYDMNAIMDAIDTYMQGFHEKYTWGYSTPYFIAGMYQCHVNNIAYLLKNHRTNASDMRNIIASLSEEERRHYDYDLLEKKYMENQNRMVDDELAMSLLESSMRNRKVLLIAPGKRTDIEKDKILKFIDKKLPIVIDVNAVNPHYNADYLFFINTVRYEYAKEVYNEQFSSIPKILLSNIKTDGEDDEYIVNFDYVVKQGWVHFDNAVINCLRLLNKLGVKEVYIAGFDEFGDHYNESYADKSLPTINPDNRWHELNNEIADMYEDFYYSVKGVMDITFLTESIFDLEHNLKE